MLEEDLRSVFHEAITHEEKLENERLTPMEEPVKRDAISDLLKNYLTQKQIDSLNYRDGLNPDEIRHEKESEKK